MNQITINTNTGIIELVDKTIPRTVISAKQSMELLGNDIVNISVKSAQPLYLQIGNSTIIYGRKYNINRLPKVQKKEKRLFVYEIEFEGVQYDLLRATYDLTIDTTTNELQDVQADSLTGDLSRFATVLIANANRVFPGKWVLGTCPDTKTITLTFSETDNCLSVLQNLCSESNFNIEFEIAQNAGINTLNFKKVGQIFPYTFQFGSGKGLYSLDRQNVSSSSIVTRLKVQGSSDNITSKYRAQRLCLPGKTKAESYIEKADAVAKYGIIEGKKFFDDIKPTFNGSVTGVFSDSVLKFVDTKMFDLNTLEADGVTTKYLIDGTNAKVHFNTGNLAGYEFEVHAYDHATHTFTLVKQTDDRGDVFPSDSSIAFQFAAGDEYKLIDVALPDTYELAAESELANKGNTYYDQNSQPKVQYGLSITKSFLENMVGNGSTVNIFQPGDYIPVKDTDIDVDKSVRIQSLTRNLLDEYDYSLTISDTVSTNITNRVISELVDIDKIVQMNNLKNPARARANWRSSREVLNMVFDPDGDYYTDKIKPNSIDTLALSVGAKSMQFGLTNTIFQPNLNGNKNLIDVQGGVLTHYTINADSARYWVLADGETTLGADTQAYYIYAKCQRVGTDGSIIFSTSQIKTEQDASYYHFWIGVLNSVDTELQARSVALSYGFTMVNGRFIKTGRIESADGTTYFDLDNSEIGGNIKFKSGQTPEDLEDYIDNIYNEISKYGSDGIITPAEKRELKIQWDEIAYEFQPLYVQGDGLSCASFEVYGDAYGALYNYLFVNPNLLNPANMGVDSTIVPADYKLVWSNYLKYRSKLRTEIAAAINSLVDIVISDGVLTPAEKLQLKSMWDGMVADHGKVVRRATAAGITALTVYTTFVSKYNTLTSYLNAIFTSMTTNSTIVPATFKTNFSDYATAKAEVEKYLDEYDEQTVTTMIANIDKAISDNWITPAEQRTLRIQWDTIEGEIGLLYNQANNLGCAGTANYYTAYTTLKNYISSIGLFVNMSASVYIANVTTFRAYWISYYQNKEIIVTQINDKLGIKASAADYLRTAMQGSTDITGGLLLTNLLMMKSNSGAIIGGMSGILADIVGMWTGGTYEQAQNGIANVILYKNGTAKIGIFKVYADRIEVDLPYGKLKFDGTGLYLLDASGNKKVEIYSGSIPTLASIVGEGSQLSVPAQSLNATFVNETVLTNFGGQFSLALASNKITMNVNATIKFTFAGSNVELYWRLRNIGTNEIIMWGSPIIYYAGELNTTKNISLSTSIYDKPAGTYQLELRIYTGGGTSFTYNKLEIASGYVNYQVINPRTIIGANGMASIYSNSEYFHVEKNVGDKMRIRLSGDVQINNTNY